MRAPTLSTSTSAGSLLNPPAPGIHYIVVEEFYHDTQAYQQVFLQRPNEKLLRCTSGLVDRFRVDRVAFLQPQARVDDARLDVVLFAERNEPLDYRSGWCSRSFRDVARACEYELDIAYGDRSALGDARSGIGDGSGTAHCCCGTAEMK